MARFASYSLLLLPIALGIFVLLAMQWRRRPVNAAPVCGRCGYDVRGLPGNVCPECGSDLRVVGVRRPGDREPLRARWRLFGWTAFVFLSVLVPLAALWGEVERRWLIVYDVSSKTSFSTPRSGAYREIRFDYHARDYGGDAPSRQRPAPEELTLILVLNDGAVRTMEVNARNPELGYLYRDSSNRTIENASGLGEDVLAAWMTDAGVTAGNPQVRQELATVVEQIHRIFERPAESGNTIVTTATPFAGSGTGTSSNVSPAPWSKYVAPAAALVVWGIGLLFVLGRREEPGRINGG